MLCIDHDPPPLHAIYAKGFWSEGVKLSLGKGGEMVML